MSGTIHSLDGAQSAQLKGIEEEKKAAPLSLADLMLLTMLDRAETLDAQIREQALTVQNQNNQIKRLSQLYAKLGDKASKLKAQGKTTTQKSTWTVNDKTTPKEILLDGGKKLVFEGKDEAWSIIDAEGNSTKISGKLNVKESDEDNRWHVQGTSTFVLDDGTKITLQTGRKDWANSVGLSSAIGDYSSSITITKDNQSVKVTGIANNKPVIGELKFDGYTLDNQTNDGNIFRMGDVNDWVYKGSEVKTHSDKTWWKNKTTGEKSVTHEETIVTAKREKDKASLSLLSEEDQQLLKEVGITVYDKSGIGMLDSEELQNLQVQLKDSRDSISSLSNIDLTKLDAYNKKYTQSLDLASGFMKSQYEQAKSTIRNMG